MRYLPIFTAVMALTMASAIHVSAQLKIGCVNSDVLLEKYPGTKAATEKFENEKSKIQKEMAKRQEELKAMNDQFERQSQSGMLSSIHKQALVDSLQQKYVQYQKYVEQQQSVIQSKYAQIFSPVSDSITKLIEKIAVTENYDIVFDKRGTIVYCLPKYDMTMHIVDALPQADNKKKGADAATKKQK